MKSPIFIMGTGRSGTSVFTRLLGLHPNIWAFRWETQIFSGLPGVGEVMLRRFNEDVVKRFTNNLRGKWFRRTIREGKPNSYDAGLFEIVELQELEIIINRFVSDLHAANNRSMRVKALAQLANNIFEVPMTRSGAKRWCEKTPRNLLFADLIAEVFPKAKFINVVRDGRDVASSMLERKFWPIARSNRFKCTSKFGGEITIEKCAQYWSCLSRIGSEMEKKLGNDMCLMVKLEDLAANPEKAFCRVLEFLGEPFDSSVLDLDSRVVRRKNPGSVNWTDVAHIGRWHYDLSIDQKRIFTEMARDELKIYGYPLDYEK